MAGKEKPPKRRMFGRRKAHKRTNYETGEVHDVKESTFEYDGIDPNQFSPEVTEQDLAGFQADVYMGSPPVSQAGYMSMVNDNSAVEIGGRQLPSDKMESWLTKESGDIFSSEYPAVEVAVAHSNFMEQTYGGTEEAHYQAAVDAIDVNIAYINEHVPPEQQEAAIAEYLHNGPAEIHVDMWAAGDGGVEKFMRIELEEAAEEEKAYFDSLSDIPYGERTKSEQAEYKKFTQVTEDGYYNHPAANKLREYEEEKSAAERAAREPEQAEVLGEEWVRLNGAARAENDRYELLVRKASIDAASTEERRELDWFWEKDPQTGRYKNFSAEDALTAHEADLVRG